MKITNINLEISSLFLLSKVIFKRGKLKITAGCAKIIKSIMD